jgi:ketosteroid isomerase-like protein
MRQFKPVLLATGLLAGVIPPAIRPAAAQHSLTSAQRSAARIRLFAVDSAHGRASRTQGLVPGFVSYLADDAVYLEPGADHVHGKRRIQAFLEGQPAGQRLSFHPGLAEVSADGTTGYTVGWTTLTLAEGGAPAVRYGKYIAFWRRKPDGSWQVEAWNRSGAQEPPSSTRRLPAGKRARPGRSLPVDPAAATRTLLSADSAFAALSVAQGTAVAFFEYAAPHGLALGAGKDFVLSREAIRDDQAANATPGQTLDWKPVTGGVSPLGDLGWTVGEFRFTAPKDGATISAQGKYLTIWEKMPDGAWRFVADGGSSSTPPAR